MTLGPNAPGTPGTPGAGTLSARLREETREAHERVERTASFNRLVVVRLPDPATLASAQDRMRRERALVEYREVYRRFLIASHGFEQAVEQQLGSGPWLAAAHTSGFETEQPAGVTLIRDDLKTEFGVDVGELPAMDAMPAPRSLAELVGVEYVRRGSRAGGAVIGAVVAHNLGLGRERGASFLCRYGRETRSVIVAFKTWADGLGLDEPGAREAIAAANTTFEAVERWHRSLERRFEREPVRI